MQSSSRRVVMVLPYCTRPPCDVPLLPALPAPPLLLLLLLVSPPRAAAASAGGAPPGSVCAVMLTATPSLYTSTLLRLTCSSTLPPAASSFLRICGQEQGAHGCIGGGGVMVRDAVTAA
jgi:hypothetical protein